MGCSPSRAASVAPASSAAASTRSVAPLMKQSSLANELLTSAALNSKRRGNVMAERHEVNESFSPAIIPKDARVRSLIAAALNDNILFSSITNVEVETMINAMAPVSFPAGAVVIRQGALAVGGRRAAIRASLLYLRTLSQLLDRSYQLRRCTCCHRVAQRHRHRSPTDVGCLSLCRRPGRQLLRRRARHVRHHRERREARGVRRGHAEHVLRRAGAAVQLAARCDRRRVVAVPAVVPRPRHVPWHRRQGRALAAQPPEDDAAPRHSRGPHRRPDRTRRGVRPTVCRARVRSCCVCACVRFW
jgi:hypothetical protein